MNLGILKDRTNQEKVRGTFTLRNLDLLKVNSAWNSERYSELAGGYRRTGQQFVERVVLTVILILKNK